MPESAGGPRPEHSTWTLPTTSNGKGKGTRSPTPEGRTRRDKAGQRIWGLTGWGG